ncbi:MAG TPA: flagellar hook-basal body complex protein [Terracidiphilus sp.]|jgi:flagellar hook protein FlgE
MPSFYIPLSGLDADSTALDTIANNLANMNTTGFKSQTTNFSDLFYQQVGANGAGDEIQAGTGVQVASNSTDFTGGSISSTGVSTDAAIDGSGFYVLDNNGSQLYTRDGDFQTSTNGTLESSDGLAVMGYGATNGVINTSGGLTDITIPTGQVMNPSATTSFSLTTNLDSQDATGSSTSASDQTKVYDSLGNSYEATVTYTKTGTNTWSYSVSVPDTLSPPPSVATTITDAVPPVSNTTGGATTIDYSFATSNGALGTVDPSTNLSITAPAGTLPYVAPTVTPGETVASYATAVTNALTTAGITGVTVADNNGTLSISGAGLTTSGSVNQTLGANSLTYNFGSSGGTLATVDPTTNLTITGESSNGGTATISAPVVTPGETITQYATALTGALATAGITGVTVASTGGTLTITGANMSTAGSVVQDPVASSNATGTLTFNSAGQLTSPAANVSGISFAGLSDGAATLNMTWDLFGSNGTANISQTASADATSATSQNGYTTGTNTGFTITGSNGIVAATYSNGQTQDVGQIAVATVGNEQGLVDVGSTEYQATSASGSASVGIAGTGERGTIEGSSLEASNVDISAEFSDLIVAQRAFEASSKAVTTFDTVTQETINMIH